MNKPKKDRQRKQINSSFMDLVYQTTNSDIDMYSLSQDNIKDILTTMEINKVDYLELDTGYGDISVYGITMETEKEAAARYKKEIKAYKADQAQMGAREKDMLIKKCKELGLKVIE